MNNLNLVGCPELKFFASDVFYHRDIYYKTRLRVPHLILNVDRGDGQTVITSAIAEFYKDNRLCTFNSSELYKEIALDGTRLNYNSIYIKMEMDQVFQGVIAVDLSKISYWESDSIMWKALEYFNYLAEKNILIIYMPRRIGRRQNEWIDMLTGNIKGMRYIPISPYSSLDYAVILNSMINDMGVRLVMTEQSDEYLTTLVAERKIDCIYDLRDLAEELIFQANYSEYYPILTEETLRNSMLQGGIAYE